MALTTSPCEMPSLAKRVDTIPAPCYDMCNNAFIEAQKVGKTPELCAEESAFRYYIQSCDACLKSFSVEIQNQADSNEISQLMDYCSGTDGGSIVTVTTLSQEAPTQVLTKATTIDGTQTVWITMTKTFSTLQTSWSGATEPSSRAWIAGPIVGSVVGALSLATISAWTWLRRRKRQRRQDDETRHDTQNQTSDKPDLGGLYGRKPELPGESARHELEQNEVYIEPVELPDYQVEVPDSPQELPADNVISG